MTTIQQTPRAFGACMPSTNSAASYAAATMTADRRRSQRRQLRQPASVGIYAVGENEDWRAHAALLNLSPEGMACRIREESEPLLQVGRTVLLRFRLQEAPAFEFLASVRNVLEAGTPGHLVVGFEFADGNTDQRQRRRLRAFLEQEKVIA